MKGVKVTIKSDTQIGGPKSTYSNDEGAFRFVGLIPGEFQLTAGAPKMKTFEQRDIRVGLNAAAEVNPVMEVETAQEVVVVKEKAPIVSTTTANVKEVFDEEFVDQLPVDVKTSGESFIGNNTPGGQSTGVRSFRVRGGASDQNEISVEGFRMNGQRTTLKSLAAMEIQTAGYGADGATVPGGVVNMVTKSGSNKFEFDVNGYAEDNNLTFFQDKNEKEKGRSYYYLINPNFSGPIVKDRVWYFLNFEGRRELHTDGPDVNGYFPQTDADPYGSLRGTLKLTWQVNPRHKLVNFTSINRRFDQYTSRGYGTYHETDAQSRVDDFDFFTGLIWEALLSDNTFFKSQAGIQQFNDITGPYLCRNDPGNCDSIPSVKQTYPKSALLQNYDSRSQTITQAFQFTNTLEWYPSSATFGQHSVKLKDDFYIQREDSRKSVPGDRKIQLNGTAFDQQTEYFSNDPRLEDPRYGWFIRVSSYYRNALTLQDSARVTRYLTINPGVGFIYAKGFDYTGYSPLDITTFTPHLSAAWDATHDGRTALRASFNQYVDANNIISVAHHIDGDPVNQTCKWNDTTGKFDSGCSYSGGSSGKTVGLPCGPTGIDSTGKSCNEKLKIPRTWEYTVGAEREIVQGVGLGLDFVYRDYTYSYERIETNRVWNTSGTGLDPTGSFRDGKNHTISDMETPEGAKRRYVGVTTALHKREGALKATVAYTWARLEGNVNSGRDNLYGDIAPRDILLYGYLPDDWRHNIRASVVYQWTQWLSTGLTWDYHSGAPYQRLYRNEVTGNRDNYLAPIGINPNSNINDPKDDRELRLPDIQKINLQVRANFRKLTGVNLELYVDVLNALALRTTTAVTTDDGPSFGQTTGRLDPFKLRLGFRYKY